MTELNFDAFSGEELYNPDGSGVLWSYRPDNCDVPGQCSFQQDLEPEYVAFNADATMAFVILQENNAVAFVSLGDTPKVSHAVQARRLHSAIVCVSRSEGEGLPTGPYKRPSIACSAASRLRR